MSRALITSGGYRRQYYRCRVHRLSGTCAAPAAVRADRDDGLEACVEAVVCRELDRRARSYVEVSDSEAMAAALAELDEARDDLESMRRDTAARRRLGPLWLSFVEPLVEAVEVAEQRVGDLRASRAFPSLSGLTADAYRSLPREERAAVLAAMIGCVFARNVGVPAGLRRSRSTTGVCGFSGTARRPATSRPATRPAPSVRGAASKMNRLPGCRRASARPSSSTPAIKA